MRDEKSRRPALPLSTRWHLLTRTEKKLGGKTGRRRGGKKGKSFGRGAGYYYILK